MQCVCLGEGIEVELAGSAERFLGIGAVRCRETVLRSAARPMFVDIRNPWGIALRDYVLSDRSEIPDGVRLTFQMNRAAGGYMDWQLHECRPRRNLTDWSRGPLPAADTALALELRSVRRTLGGRVYDGFQYQYSYRSASIPIYLILDRGTWELNGSAMASELWMRQGCAPAIYQPGSADEHYSTEWYLQSCTNPNIFQFLPFQTHLQGFTMTAGEAGILFTWSPQLCHLRSLIEKPRGTDTFVHLHEHCGDLTDEFSSAPMEVLFCPGASDPVARANAYGEMSELVAETLHEAAGLRREYVPTYGQIEEWTDADLDFYRREGVPALAAAGMRCIEVANHCANDMNTWGISNMCCTVDYKVAERVGEDKLQAFCQDAAARGIRVMMWANTAISSTTVRFAERNGTPKGIEFLPLQGSIMEALAAAERPFVLNSYGQKEADHYGPAFCVLNLRDPVVRRYWLESWRQLHDRVGLGGVFLDSSFNLSSDKFDWRGNADARLGQGATIDQTDLLGQMRPAEEPPATIESEYLAHLSLVREMQAMGYAYCAEDSGVFGIHRNGPAIQTRLGNLHLWREFLAHFDAPAIRAAGVDPDDVFFRGLAYRLMWSLHWDPPSRELTFRAYGARHDDDRPRPWHLDLFRAYNDVEPYMRRREILPEFAGVVYRHQGCLVLWAFTACRLPLAQSMSVHDVLAGTTVHADVIEGARHNLYLARETP